MAANINRYDDDNPFSKPGGAIRKSEKSHRNSIPKSETDERIEGSSVSSARSSGSNLSPHNSGGLTVHRSGGPSRVPVRDFRGNASAPSWDRDWDYSECLACEKPFTVLRRRHHCRGCGHIFCSKCTPSPKLLMPMNWNTKLPQRVCITCAGQLRPLQPQLSAAYRKS